jgi:hypothetical protein
MRPATQGFSKFHCAWCDRGRGGIWNAAVGYRCTNPSCGFLVCDECVRFVGLMGKLTDNCACPRCGNAAERAVN